MNNLELLADVVTQALRRIRYHSDEVVLDSVSATEEGRIYIRLANYHNNSQYDITFDLEWLGQSRVEQVNAYIDEAFRTGFITGQ